MDMSGGDEHRALHYAVLRRDARDGATADGSRRGRARRVSGRIAMRPPLWRWRREREYGEIVAVIEEEERLRTRGDELPQCHHFAGAGPDQRGYPAIRECNGDRFADRVTVR